ncbi:MAG: fused MFS/spermidine synthase [Bacteroidales bacterium]|nr:fused MFS/spermidine synthase [Bacteroidales bacterium]
MHKSIRHTLQLLALLMGFSCFIVQIVMIREFMNLFMGNELIIGIILAMWMLFTALGAIVGRFAFDLRHMKFSLIILLVLNAIFPLAGALFATWLKGYIYAPGVMVSLQGVLLISIAGLTTFCVVSGMMYTMLASYFSKNNQSGISRIYMLEAVGNLAGGIVFNFVLVYTLDSMTILSIILILNVLAAAYYAISEKLKLIASATLIVAGLAFALLFTMDLDMTTASLRYKNQEVLLNSDTPFGKLVVTEQGGQTNFYHNGNPVASGKNIVEREEQVHYAMCLHPDPRNVLLLGGGIDGTAEEVLKYPAVSLDYVDPDIWSLKAAKKYLDLSWPEGVEVHHTDTRRFLDHTSRKYDLIILNSEVPATIGNNRFYTKQFFGSLKSRLHENGMASVRLPGGSNYLDEPLRRLYSSIYKTLKQEFLNIRIIPGNHTYFIASDGKIQGDITQLIEQKNIPTGYVNLYYINDAQIDLRARQYKESLLPEIRVNTDFYPIAPYIIVLRWLGMFQLLPWVVTLIPLLIMAVLVFLLKPLNLGLFTTGFTASAAEFLLLIAFQVVYGFIYQMAGIIIMCFMAGLAAGSGYFYRFIPITKAIFIRIQLSMGILIGLMPLLLVLTSRPELLWVPGTLIGLLTFATGTLTGLQYRLATLLRKGQSQLVASSTYGADLAGSAFGIFFIAVFLFPLAGMIYTGLILAFLNFLTVARLSFTGSRV